MPTPVDDSVVYISGPWTHRVISANGSSFHLAEAGTGPLVILLHGFGEFWWTWRYQLPALAQAGYRAVAIDLRGYGASDKPPRGYDLFTISGDVTGLITALGEENACLIGHDWGGIISWATAALHPEMVRAIGLLGSTHPLKLGKALTTNRQQIAASSHIFAVQLPRYEYRITAKHAAWLADRYDKWAGPAWRASIGFREHVALCTTAIQIQQAAFCATEYYRWGLRSLTRRSGWRFVRLMGKSITANVWHMHGTLDTCILPSTAHGEQQYTTGALEYQQLDGVGHFPHLEATDYVNAELLSWLKTL